MVAGGGDVRRRWENLNVEPKESAKKKAEAKPLWEINSKITLFVLVFYEHKSSPNSSALAPTLFLLA